MVKVSEFQKDGKTFPTIELRNGASEKFGFTFGLGKARMILENYDEIRQFVEDNARGGNN